MAVGNETVGDGSLRRLKTAVGKPVAGDQFFDRVDEIAHFIEILDEGDNISLIAPRRVGKSSLMREVSRRIDERYLCLHLDLEACRAPADFFAGLARVTSEHVSPSGRLRTIFDHLVQGVDEMRSEHLALEVAKLFSTGWRERGDRLFHRLSEMDRPVVLFLDEVPIFVHRLLTDETRHIQGAGVQRADDFLSWLRAVALRHGDRLRIVVAGSIGLAPVLHRAGLSATINAYRSFELRPWDEATTCECLQALARNYGLSFESGAENAVYKLLGAGIPHHVQMFFDHLRQHLKRKRVNAAFPGDVEHVYGDRMLSSRGHPDLSHYEERLNLVLDPGHLPMAMDLLTEAALGGLSRTTAERVTQEHGPDGLEDFGDLDNILDILVHDGYLRRDGDLFAFESNLVRDWWKNRHASTYRRLASRGAT
jgi:hypothetical protein